MAVSEQRIYDWRTPFEAKQRMHGFVRGVVLNKGVFVPAPKSCGIIGDSDEKY